MELSLKTAALCVVLGLSSFVAAGPTAVQVAERASCTPASAGNAGTDDVPAIQAAIKSCGSGGTIVLPSGVQYAIRSTLSFAGCTGCTVQLEGTLKMSEDLDYWNGIRSTILISGIKGLTWTSTTGNGVVDGNGVPYWIEFASNSDYARPTLVSVEGGSSNVKITNLRFKNPANVFHSISGASTNVLYENLKMDATPKDGATPKNTDGFDVGSSSYVTIRSVDITNQDDCIALKPGSNYAYATDITCTGSHGLSVGSLGKGAGSTDTVTNAYIGPATMIDSTKALGIKLYEGGSSHGVATISNVTWSDITVDNCDYAIQIQSCYGASDTTNCVANTDKMTDVYIKNISGKTSSKYSPVTGNLHCSASATCNVVVSGYTVTPPSGSSQVLCSNIDGTLGISCSGSASG